MLDRRRFGVTWHGLAYLGSTSFTPCSKQPGRDYNAFSAMCFAGEHERATCAGWMGGWVGATDRVETDDLTKVQRVDVPAQPRGRKEGIRSRSVA